VTRAELPVLRAQLTAERERLARVASEIDSLLAQTTDREPTRVEVVAGAAYLHNLYNAVENCLLRLAHAVDHSVPDGPDSHRVLLDQMTAPIEGLRPALLDRRLAARLDEYRRFRHAFRHMYFFDIDWPRVHPLLAGSRAVCDDVLRALDDLITALVPKHTGY
jgi:uncharacterized protein YutE (UPF0331/DUF86 family)